MAGTHRGSRTAAVRGRPLVVLALLLPPLVAASGSPALGPGAAPRPFGREAEPTALAVTVSPATWWMVGGTAVTLSAAWTGLPPGCDVVPAWFRWALASGGADGSLAGTNGSRANFTAGELLGGPTQVRVLSAATVACGTQRTAAFRTGSAVITVEPPLVVTNLSVEPNPAPPNTTVDLLGTIVGGAPPYAITVAWGNGTVARATVDSGGNFEVPQRLGVGSYSPEAFVTDANGLVANATVEEPEAVSPGFAIGIAPESWLAEVGVPLGFAVQGVGAPQNLSFLSGCESVAPGDRPTAGLGTSLSCRFGRSGPAEITAVAAEAEFPFAVASATVDEPVVPPLSVLVPPTPISAEVGRPAFAPLRVSGGVPPFEVEWRLVGSGATARQTLSADGGFLAEVEPPVPGSDLLEVTAEDALGVIVANETASVVATPALSASVEANGTVSRGGALVNLSGSALSGAPPLLWVVVPARAPSNASPEWGLLGSPGPFGWNATLRSEGPLALLVGVVDAAGAVWSVNLTVPTVPALRVSASAADAGSGSVVVSGAVAGGAPPFDLWINVSAGSLWNGSLGTDGSFQVRLDPGGAGALDFSVTVVDAWGATSIENGSVEIAGSSGALGSSAALGVGVGATLTILAASAAGATLWWRRRRRPGPSAREAPDPIATLRDILSPADGADRSVVELLAEERGVPIGSVRTTIDRLVEEGVIRSERGSDGEEVLAWSRLL
jgi:hypothetical protein